MQCIRCTCQSLAGRSIAYLNTSNSCGLTQLQIKHHIGFPSLSSSPNSGRLFTQTHKLSNTSCPLSCTTGNAVKFANSTPNRANQWHEKKESYVLGRKGNALGGKGNAC